jgi:DNA-binding response OmpR family regulator
VAEDDWLLAEMLIGTLHAAGCVVVGPAAGLARTIELAQRCELDGALLDINLAGEMCYPAAKLLQERNVSFAFMTAYAQSAIPAPLRSAGFLGKPSPMRHCSKRSQNSHGRKLPSDRPPPRPELALTCPSRTGDRGGGRRYR